MVQFLQSYFVNQASQTLILYAVKPGFKLIQFVIEYARKHIIFADV